MDFSSSSSSRSSDYDYYGGSGSSDYQEIDYTKLCFEIWQAKSDEECTRLLTLFGKVVEEWKNFEQRDNLTHITNMEKFQQHVGWNLDNWTDWIELIIMSLVSIACAIVASCAILFNCNWRNVQRFLDECHDPDRKGAFLNDFLSISVDLRSCEPAKSTNMTYLSERRGTNCSILANNANAVYLSPTRTE